MTTPRRIPHARFLVGILLHVCIPAYLLACLAAAFLRAPVVTAWAAVPGRMLWTAGWFVPAFALATVTAAGMGRLLDRRAPRAPDPAQASRAAVADGRGRLSLLGIPQIDRAMARLDGVAWDHEDPRVQAVAADLQAAARTFAAAHASAAPEGRAAILDLAATSIARLADAVAAIDAERRRLDQGDARTVAGYIDARYR